jgi:uncharacterized protein (DUF1330 family)
MSAYILAHVDVKNWDAYREYMSHTPRVIAKFGGRFVARGGEMVTLEGPEETLRVVLVEFPTLDSARNFYNSPDYKAVKKLREGAGGAKLVAIDGYPLEKWQESVAESEKLSLPES